MGIATELETAITGLLNTFLVAKSQALSVALTPIAVTGATLYLIAMGYAIARGDAGESVNTVLWKTFRMVFIAGLAVGTGSYQVIIVEGINALQQGLIETMSGKSTIGGLIDSMSKPYEELGTYLLAKATTGTLPKLSLLLAAVIVFLAQAVLFIIGLGYYLLAKVGLTLVFAVGPLFIMCAMWPATQKYCENWIGTAMNYVLLNVLVASCIAMLTDFASKYAQTINAAPDAANIMYSILALLICSCALAVIMLNLPQLATALAGGATISGIGRDIKNAMDSAFKPKSPSPTPPEPHPGPKPEGGKIEKGKGKGDTPAQPLYQSKTIENLQKPA
ncbi:type IV secretion system protein [Massilia scottii]|uniref:type IV secretion system protein n=1 Tax=Massilia scottii TaxID=3057166 RepID=UPI0027968FF0|nr:type IV secretion system protein [Massilia sp. CCM 9029]MDQ1829843.1 type IV secretion system protein [Massilia sp. CCM 9029]